MTKTKKKVRLPSAKAEDQPATRKMLKLVRKELVHRMDGGFAKLDSRFAKIDSRFARIDERFAKIDERFAKIDERFARIDERFAKVDARFDHVDARLARMELLLEEQNANNRIVLEGLQALWQRQDHLEARLDSR